MKDSTDPKSQTKRHEQHSSERTASFDSSGAFVESGAGRNADEYTPGSAMRWQLVDDTVSAQNSSLQDDSAIQDPAFQASSSQGSESPIKENIADALGARLQQARLNKGWSLEELAQYSLVHTRFIHCLEQGKDTRLAETYVRGYLRLLAGHLDLDAAQLLAMYSRAGAEESASSDSAMQLLGEHRAADAAAGSNPFLAQARMIANEALGVLALALGNLRRALSGLPGLLTGQRSGSQSLPRFSHESQSGTVSARAASKATATTAESETAPRALVHQGSAWSTPSLLHASAGLRWSSVAISLCGFLVLAGLYVGQEGSSDDGSRDFLASAEENAQPLGELAAKALGEHADASSVEGESESFEAANPRQLLPLNRDERRAALAEIESETAGQLDLVQNAETQAAAAVSGDPLVSGAALNGTQAQGARVAAIESAVADSRQTDLAVSGDYANVRSIINVGPMNADGQVKYAQEAANTPLNARLSDSYEPVGPGAEYMIAQYARQDRLVISVYEDSWVDVRDSNGVRLYRDLARAGRRIDLSGDLPFSLHVGNAPGLAIELNGEYVPIERYRSDNSARLTLAKP